MTVYKSRCDQLSFGINNLIEFSFGDFAVRGSEVSLLFTGLQAGDEIRLITEKDTEILNAPKGAVQLMLKRNYPDALFLRLELYRSYAPGLPPMKALLSNPVYFG